MRQISTVGRQLSTDGTHHLCGWEGSDYCLPMIDITLATSFGDLLDRMMRARLLSIQKAMDVLECSRAMVDKYRRGGSKPSPEKLRKFGTEFGYDYGDLLKLVHGRDADEAERKIYPVYTERGAVVGRTFENLPNDQIRAAFYELLLTLSNDLKQTGGKSGK